jgi:lipoprotein NlpD
VGVVCCFLACGCAATPETTAHPGTYVVRPQDTLYGIAWRHNLDYRELAQWNNIGPDYKLVVGQVLVLQPVVGRQRSAAPRPTVSSSVTAPIAQPAKPAGVTANPAISSSTTASPSVTSAPHVGKPRPLADPPALAGSAPAPVQGGGLDTSATGGWVWPTDRVSAPRPVPGGGILVLGKLGQDVRAASSGRVVYTGSGLRGYGNLIIVKHGDSLLSSYAHNRDLLVHEGQEVAAGQIIAHMGTGPHQISALYFEIRVNGKPVDPLRYLAAPR